MLEGAFDVAVDTPKRHLRGTLALKGAGSGSGALAARLSLSEMEPLDFTGTCDDREFTFEGTADLPGLGKTAYKATGEVWGNSIDVKCETDAGRITIYGTRLSGSAGDLKSSYDYLMKASAADFTGEDNTMFSGRYADGA